ncbi:MAG: aromatic ring-hydroxylating dioxygenase subunit alpha [Verrucomicrobiales bacterium]
METRIFNRRLVVVEGWYWALRSRSLRRGKAKAVTLNGRDLVLYRTAGGDALAADAYCPHMGCHLSLGKVEGDCLRCFFHNWAFAPDGRCAEVPSLDQPPAGVRLRVWHTREASGVIWVWVGDGEPAHDVPVPPELAGTGFDFALGRSFRKNCHPNVVMINAIDEQHFRTVHKIPGEVLSLAPEETTPSQIQFRNTEKLPPTNAVFRWASRFYAGPLRYELSYWYGHNGAVTMGPDFLHVYIMFALRQSAKGGTEGQTLVFTRRRRGILGWLVNRLLLLVTHWVGNYFSVGDTKVFQTIRFDYRTPVPADRAVQAFIRHLERQNAVAWAEPRRLAAVAPTSRQTDA